MVSTLQLPLKPLPDPALVLQVLTDLYPVHPPVLQILLDVYPVSRVVFHVSLEVYPVSCPVVEKMEIGEPWPPGTCSFSFLHARWL